MLSKPPKHNEQNTTSALQQHNQHKQHKQKQMANAVRALAMDGVEKAKSGHPGLPLGAADIATILFSQFLKIDPLAPNWPDRDRFILSAGHGSMLQYAIHYLIGYQDMSLEEIKNFRQLGGRTAGHPEYGLAQGVEATTGPLGQGLGMGVGMALAERNLNARFGDGLVNHHTYILASDGDLMEGISHEAINLAGHLKLSRLIVLYDDNGISIDGQTSLTDSSDALKRFEAAQWDARRIDGHNANEIEDALSQALKTDKPSLIACKTIIGFGAPNKQNKQDAHGSPLGEDEIVKTREALGWESKAFEIPSSILDAWRVAGRRHVSTRKKWEERLKATHPEIRYRFQRMMKGKLPETLNAKIQDHKKTLANTKPTLATRKSSGDALLTLTKTIKQMIGGSADLTGSNNTYVQGQTILNDKHYGGGFIHYGVREHGMAAVMNGIALHGGLIPYSGTFLIFSDYMRPALRLAALMKQRVIHVMTHDSIGLGEDGPTHQPIEQLSSLRAIPNLLVFRPADAIEVTECWQAALEAKNSPTILALTRQKLPPIRTTHTEQNLCAKGGYELAPSEGIPAIITLLATGSELHLALEAKAALEAQQLGTRVVSMPCFELFAQQNQKTQNDILGETKIRIAIEAGLRQSWDRFLRPQDGFIGLDDFGASAPQEDLYQHFKLTKEAIIELATEKLNQLKQKEAHQTK